MKLQRYLAPALGLLISSAHSLDPLVDVEYSRYQGKALDNGITQWLGIRYAAPPIGDLRWCPPQDPPKNETIQDASNWTFTCLAARANLATIGKTQSEDCLFLNVFAPSDASPDKPLPVFFYIQGGGFSSNSSPYVNGSSLIIAGEMDIIIVTLNYRVGPYGFLFDGDKITPNLGLLDQRKALEWVQQHISKFGGDPGHITLGGVSAGAASVALQLSAYDGKDTGLFHAVAAESVSFATVLTVEESVYQYDNFVIRLGCAGKHSLACLRRKSSEELQKANVNIPYPGSPNPPLYMWNPAVDGTLVPDVTYKLFEEGKFIKVPAIFGDDTNGGTMFTPRDTSTLGESNVFLKSYFPFLTLEHLGRINKLYPNKNDTCPNLGCYWRQVSDAYGDMRYMCPALYISSAFTNFGSANSWNYRYNVEDPDDMASGLGVQHTVEIHAIFGPEYTGGTVPKSYFEGEVNAAAVPVLQGYWSSFIRTYDPNTYRAPGSVKWETWTDKRKQRILFETGGVTRMEKVSRDQEKKCDYLTSIGVEIRQ